MLKQWTSGRSGLAAIAVAAMAWATGPAHTQEVQPDAACAHIFIDTGFPEIDGDTSVGVTVADSGPDRTFVCRDGYALMHNNLTHIPDWVAEDVTSDEIVGPAVRKDNFAPDPLTPAPGGSSLENYRASGYDRGHQAPAADFKSDQALMDASFFLSNMAPQVGQCFNRGIWADLEDEVRGWAETRERLIVFTGPIYPDPIVTIGDLVKKKPGDPVAVPKSFFKIVYHPATKQSVAFVLPNERLCSQDPADFIATIGQIRELTGINFFPAASRRQRTILERSKGSKWGW